MDNLIEQLINELKEDSCELHYKKRSLFDKIAILENMIGEVNSLKTALENELNSIVS